MKKTWMYVCFPPLLGLLVFGLVKSAGSVDVPTQEQIDAAPSRQGGGRFDAKRLEEALRRAGMGQNSSPESTTPKVRPQSPAPSTKSDGPYKEDLIKLRYERLRQNRQAYIRGLIAGIVVTILGYVVVGIMMYSHYRAKPTWQDALAKDPNPQAGNSQEE